LNALDFQRVCLRWSEAEWAAPATRRCAMGRGGFVRYP
jgi:hypothetical protein